VTVRMSVNYLIGFGMIDEIEMRCEYERKQNVVMSRSNSRQNGWGCSIYTQNSQAPNQGHWVSRGRLVFGSRADYEGGEEAAELLTKIDVHKNNT